MPRPRKKARTEVVQDLVIAGLSLLDSSDSSSDDSDNDDAPPNVAALAGPAPAHRLPPLPPLPPLPEPGPPLPAVLPPLLRLDAPLFRVAELRNLLAQNVDTPFEEFEPFDNDDNREDNNFEAGGPAHLEPFEPFDDLGDNPFPPFDSDGENNNDLPQLFLPNGLDWLDGDDDKDEDDEDEDNDRAADEWMGLQLLTLAEELERLERGPYGRFRKSQDWFEVSMSWPPSWFEDTYRVSSRTFWRIATRLQQDRRFQSKGRKPQRPVPVQLACFLYRYGRYGSTAFDANATISLGVGTVHNYCKRVSRALRKVGLECVAWPNKERKREISDKFESLSGIPGVVGVGDGSLFGLKSKPLEEGDSYVTYKGSVATNVFCAVDCDKRFIAHDGGWAGCKSDRTTFRASKLWECRGELFERGEVMLVDKGFFTSPYTCRPYDKRELGTGTREERAQKRQFNMRFSKARIFVEHAFGMLKMRFPSLRFMGTSRNIQISFKAIEALIVVYNLCIDFKDADAPDEYDVQDDNELPDILHQFPGHIDPAQLLREGGWDGHETNEWLKAEGNRVREEIRIVSQHWAENHA